MYAVLFNFLLPLFSHLSVNEPPLLPLQPPQRDDSLRFELRHYHAVASDNNVVFSDALPSVQLTEAPYIVRTRSISTFRPSSFDQFTRARSYSRQVRDRNAATHLLHWDEDEVIAPDVDNHSTILELAKMTNNAYVEPGSSEWYKLESNWTVVSWRLAADIELVMTTCLRSSPIHSAGNLELTGSEATYSLPLITGPSSCPSRVHLGSCGRAAGPPPGKIKSTTMCFLVAVVDALAGHGHRSATVIAGTINVTRIAWKTH